MKENLGCKVLKSSGLLFPFTVKKEMYNKNRTIGTVYEEIQYKKRNNKFQTGKKK